MVPPQNNLLDWPKPEWLGHLNLNTFGWLHPLPNTTLMNVCFGLSGKWKTDTGLLNSKVSITWSTDFLFFSLMDIGHPNKLDTRVMSVPVSILSIFLRVLAKIIPKMLLYVTGLRKENLAKILN
jgi:hypothetical protein